MTEAKPNRHIPKPPVGWPLLQTPRDGQWIYPVLEESIRQSIKIILLTRPGEQLMRAWFGAGLARFLHLPNTLETRQQIQDLIFESLDRWEKRIAVDRVDVSEGNSLDHLRIDIAYRIKRSGNRAAMVLKLNLGS